MSILDTQINKECKNFKVAFKNENKTD